MEVELKSLLFNYLKNDLERDVYKNPHDLMVNNIDNFIRSLDISSSSKITYKKQVGEFIKWLYKKSITNLSKEIILEYKEWLRDIKNLKPGTVSNYIVTLRIFFNWAESQNITPNISKGVKGCKRERGFKKDALNLKQVKKILSFVDDENISNLRDYAIVNLMIRTGLRVTEICNINTDDIIKKDNDTILYIKGKGRESKDEFVVLTEETLYPINNYLRNKSLDHKFSTNNILFVSHSKNNLGSRLTTRSISRIVKNKLIETKLSTPRLTAHSLRHTAITLSLLGGSSLQEAQALARHQNINTTLIYAHNISRLENAPEKKINLILKDN